MSLVRTRFAPSPTGYMHVGGVRTAIFAWVYARQQNGDFILRIEDTDKSREVEGSIAHIIESLKWLGIDWSEGPDVGGKYGPYLQSERLDIYRQWAQKLIDKNLAYVDPFTPEKVSEFRAQAKDDKKAFLFRDFRPDEVLTPDDWYGKVPLRFKVENPSRTDWKDEVRGELSAGPEALDDFILIKADGYPTYNFAHVIDDYLMKITHVMRGEEFISSTPKFISLHEALKIPIPLFATMPTILGKDGGKKLSKRDGAKDVLDYRDEGYLPEAMINFLSSLGWNDGTEKEIFTVAEIIESFSLNRIQKKGAHFDNAKLDWLNWQHFEKLLTYDLSAALELVDIKATHDNLSDFAQLAATKSRSPSEFINQMSIFLGSTVFEINDESLNRVDKELSVDTAKSYLLSSIEALENIDFTSQVLEETLRADMKKLKAEPRQYLNLIRWSVSNHQVSPNLFAMMELLGHDESIKRLKASADS